MNQSVYKYLPLSGCFISFFNFHFVHSGLHKNLGRFCIDVICVCDSNGLILLFSSFSMIFYSFWFCFVIKMSMASFTMKKQKLSISTAFYLSSLIVVMMRIEEDREIFYAIAAVCCIFFYKNDANKSM